MYQKNLEVKDFDEDEFYQNVYVNFPLGFGFIYGKKTSVNELKKIAQKFEEAKKDLNN